MAFKSNEEHEFYVDNTLSMTVRVAGINLVPQANHPSPLQDGDLWITSAGLFARISGVTLQLNGSGGSGGSGGGVSSVALTVPSFFSVAGSPVTSAGTLAISANTQGPNTFLAGPTGGAASTPSFRTLLPADVPELSTEKITTGTLGTSRGGTGYSTYEDGHLLIGNSSNNSLSKATLTAGSGITITNGNGAITVSTTASAGITFTAYQMSLTSSTVAARIDDVNNMSNRVYTVQNIGYYAIYIGSDSTVSTSTGFKIEPGDVFETVLTSSGALWGVTEFASVQLSVLRGQ
jgi:hypothetical protein